MERVLQATKNLYLSNMPKSNKYKYNDEMMVARSLMLMGIDKAFEAIDRHYGQMPPEDAIDLWRAEIDRMQEHTKANSFANYMLSVWDTAAMDIYDAIIAEEFRR